MNRRLCVALTAVLGATLSCNSLDSPASPRTRQFDWRAVGTGGGCPGEQNRTPGASRQCEHSYIVHLNCAPAVDWGGNSGCSVTVEPSGTPFQVTQWLFEGANVVVTSSGSSTWNGSMVTSGNVSVTLSIDGGSYSEGTYITVNRRSGWSWAGSVSGRQAYPGEIDECVYGAGGPAGLASGESCSYANPGVLFTPASVSEGNGYSAGQVGNTGPNAGVWYTNSPTVTMHLRSQVNSMFRSDGQPFPVNGTVADDCNAAYGNYSSRNTYQVNVVCEASYDFDSFLAYAWGHEGLHLDAGVSKGQSSEGNLHAKLEPLVGNSSGSLSNDVYGVVYDTHAAIDYAMHATHTGLFPEYTFWRFLSNAWQYVTTMFYD